MRVQMVLTIVHSIGVIHAVAMTLKVSMDVAVAIWERRRFQSNSSYIEVILEGFPV